MTAALPLDAEWLESDARGGFASGTVAGYRTRRYHALLLAPRRPPGDRVVLVNGFEAWVDAGTATFPVSTQHYTPDVIHPRGIDHLTDFAQAPWPHWTFDGPGGVRIVQECVVDRAEGCVLVAWRQARGPAVQLRVRPLLSGRQYHALMRENDVFDFAARGGDWDIAWQPYPSMPLVSAVTNGRYTHEPQWYRRFLYREEAARGLDCIEDLASPGTFSFDLAGDEAIIVLRAGEANRAETAAAAARRIRDAETVRRKPLSPLDAAAESYLVRRGDGETIIAGFPWFTDWGRDTFIAVRGLALTRGRYEAAASILLAWADQVSAGMLPNRFADDGAKPEFNSVDASLWFAIAVDDFLDAARPPRAVRSRLTDAVAAIVEGYRTGTRYGIGMDRDGLLACGVAGTSLTWMDARVDDRAVTPRVGKPVEVQALWINALRAAGCDDIAAQAQTSFRERFWNPRSGCLYDVVDVDHHAGSVDASIRPNQILAAGGLPSSIVEGDVARAIVATVERELVTPLGLRSLAPGDPAYRPRYEGGVRERDCAYHQGTAWPWLVGPFVDAWLRVNGDDDAHRAEARRRWLVPVQAHLQVAGLGHVSEIADGDPPHTPRGCPFQAWSTGELIRALARTAPN